MENAIFIAAEAYASIEGNMSTQQVLEAIQGGNKVVLRSVLNLMEVTA